MPGQVSAAVGLEQTLNGMSFFASTGLISIVLLSNLRVLLSNPAGSGRIMLVTSTVYFSSIASGAFHIWGNPTTNLPTTVKKVNNCYGSVTQSFPAGVGLLKADTGAALSGGTDTGVDLDAGANNPFTQETETTPFILGPGCSIGINLPAVAAVNAHVNFAWLEMPGF